MRAPTLFAGPWSISQAVRIFNRNPKLIPLAMIPGVVALAVSLLGFWLGFRYGAAVLDWMWPEPAKASWTHWLWTGLKWMGWLLTAILSWVLSSFMVLLLGMPLCDPLQQKVERLLGSELKSDSFMREIARAVRHALVIVGIGITGAIGLGIIGLIPGMTAITAPFTAFVWAPFFVAWDVHDPNMSRRQMLLKTKLGILLRQPIRSLSMGLCCKLLIGIPFINLVGLPIAAVAGVVMVREMEMEGKFEGLAGNAVGR